MESGSSFSRLRIGLPSEPPSLPAGTRPLCAVASRVVAQRPALSGSLVVHGRSRKGATATIARTVRKAIHGLLPATETSFATAGVRASV